MKVSSVFWPVLNSHLYFWSPKAAWIGPYECIYWQSVFSKAWAFAPLAVILALLLICTAIKSYIYPSTAVICWVDWGSACRCAPCKIIISLQVVLCMCGVQTICSLYIVRFCPCGSNINCSTLSWDQYLLFHTYYTFHENGVICYWIFKGQKALSQCRLMQ